MTNLSLAFIIFSILFMVFYVSDEMAEDAMTINLAGRQRMLTQKMTKEFLLYHKSGTTEDLNALQTSAWVFDETLTGLLTGGEGPLSLDRRNPARGQLISPTPVVKKELEKVAQIWKPIFNLIQSLQQNTSQTDRLRDALLSQNVILLKTMNRAVFMMSDESKADVDWMKSAVLDGAIASMFILVLMFYILYRLNRQLNRIQRRLTVLSHGQLEKAIKVKGTPNELDEMAMGVNRLRDHFMDVIRNIFLQANSLSAVISELTVAKESLAEDSNKNYLLSQEIVLEHQETQNNIISIQRSAEETAKKVAGMVESTNHLSNNISAMAESSEYASHNVTTMASAAEEITANIGGVNNNLVDVDRAVHNVANSIEEMKGSLEQIRKRCQEASLESEDANGKARNTHEIMDELSHSAQEIGKVVSVINNIADQTNMLALNASIEAAGAGEAGAGFSVVANEVKDLANQTGEATKMISQQIQTMQNKTEAVEAASQDITESIDRINQGNMEISHAVDEQTETVNEIADAMQGVANAAGEVTRNAKELSSAAEDVAREALTAANGMQDIASAAVSSSQEAQNLAIQNEEVNEQSSQVSVAAKNAAEKTQQANAKVQKILTNVSLINGAIQHTARLVDTASIPGHRLIGSVGNVSIGSEPLDVQTIKGAHLQWLGKLENVIRGRAQLRPEEVASGRECLFGKWYYSDGDTLYGSMDIFKQVGVVHLRVHEIAREAVKLVQEKRTEAAEEKMKEFDSVKDKLFEHLDELYLQASKKQASG
ncbi:methyl-accepting chemotaxis protein [Magnetococcales bacterium HHB-1]